MLRGQTDYSFLIGVDKPCGVSSHDVVNKVRNIVGEKRVGHMGTLDPFASGVLIIGVGPATRLDNFIQNHNKSYSVKATFGASTNTYDTEGQVTQTCVVEDKFFDKEFAKKCIDGLVGKRMQKPPAFSAVKINGQPAYKQAREGKDVDIDAREIEVFDAKLIDVEKDVNSSKAIWAFDVTVSKGTYIRSLVHDLGQSLDCCAHASALQRTCVGNVSIDMCYSLDEFENDFKHNKVKKINAVEMLGFEQVDINDKELSFIINGNIIDKNVNTSSNYVCAVKDNCIVAICKSEGNDKLCPKCVFKNPVEF